MYQFAEQRDAGWSLTDSLVAIRMRLQRAGVSNVHAFDRMVGAVYEQLRDGSPTAIRQGWEEGCMTRSASAFRSSGQPRQRPPDTRTLGTSIPKSPSRY